MIGEKIKQIRELNKAKQSDLANFLHVTQSAVSMWEAESREPSLEIIKKIALLYNVSVDYLLGKNNENLNIKKSRIPVLGTIPAGIPVEMVEDLGEYEDIDPNLLIGDQEYFALKIKGDSMSPKFMNEDILIVRKQDDCESGSECIVTVNGFDATFKKIIKKETGIILQPLNSAYEPQIFSYKECEELPVKILGEVIEIRRTLKKSK